MIGISAMAITCSRGRALLLAAAASCVACGAGSPTTPTGPAATRGIKLEGEMAFGNIQMGTALEMTFRIHSTGTEGLMVTGVTAPAAYAVTWTGGVVPAGSSQAVTVRFSPTADQDYNGTLTVNANHTTGTNTLPLTGTGTIPPGMKTTLGPGTYVVGTDIVAGRYFTDPASSCYWERLSGLGGTFGEIIANEFITFNAGQWIVEISGSDRAFRTVSACSTWDRSPRRGQEANITAGLWLVGDQVRPGIYRSTVASGCYWERTRNFSGIASGVIANGFVGTAGQQMLEIKSGDVGFHSGDKCGTWTPSAALLSDEGGSAAPQSPADIEANWQQHRRASGLR